MSFYNERFKNCKRGDLVFMIQKIIQENAIMQENSNQREKAIK